MAFYEVVESKGFGLCLSTLQSAGDLTFFRVQTKKGRFGAWSRTVDARYRFTEADMDRFRREAKEKLSEYEGFYKATGKRLEHLRSKINESARRCRYKLQRDEAMQSFYFGA